ncbi:MAG TPA: DNA cytosine methyltransferase [Terriglobales bacterium]|nr:DNA cytosine methyltransferase [Terriglobales bacterium]
MLKPRAISLFSGCGGSDYALHDLGMNIVWANDIWDIACQTYRDNIPRPSIESGDISEFGNFPQAELLVGCYPCQGYSQGGKRDWDSTINFLYRQFASAMLASRKEHPIE